jgi:N-methylhydantoinase B
MTALPAVQIRVAGHNEPDPISVEVLRSRLDALGREAGLAIERTAISPVVSETKDYSVTIIDADGRLITGTGYITGHFGASVNAVRATIGRHGGTIAPGDVFLANDPHNGGGLHPNDVIVQRPAFAEGHIVGWVAVSAHMMDMGGMTPGSLSPQATECFQEALRFPPVRLLRQGIEERDIWSILRINVRSASIIEADLRALVAGCNVAVAKLEKAVAALGAESFRQSIARLERATRDALDRRIELIADGVYRSAGWLELGEREVYAIPCRLTVAGSRLGFDFAGCPPQLPRYFNSKPYIVQSTLASKLHRWLAADLPYSQALLDLIEVRCPARSLLNCEPPRANWCCAYGCDGRRYFGSDAVHAAGHRCLAGGARATTDIGAALGRLGDDDMGLRTRGQQPGVIYPHRWHVGRQSGWCRSRRHRSFFRPGRNQGIAGNARRRDS